MSLIRAAVGALLAATAVVADPPPYDKVAKCCNTLKNYYSDLLFQLDDTKYSDVNERWSLTAELNPTCIFLPNNADAVSSFIKVVVEGGCPFAIKSGGHNPWSGVNDIDTGISLDLSSINEVTLKNGLTTVTVGAGGKWGDVYKALEPHGIMLPGARAYGVGVGGMTLGGGLSYFTPRVGLTADNVYDFEVVLASGETVIASENVNDDLFYALKGGSSNFGIVTRVGMNGFQNGPIWGGEIMSPINATDDALHHLHEFVTNSNEDVNAAVELVFNLNTTDGAQRIISIVADTAGNSNSSLLQSFQSLPKFADTSRNTSMSGLAIELQSRLPAGGRYLFATVTFMNDLDTLRWVHNISLSTFNDHRDIPDVTWNLVYESLPIYYRNFGPNPIGLNYTSGNRITLVLNPTWLDTKYDDHMAEAARDWVDRIQKWTNIHGTASQLELLPYSAPFQDPLGYYGDDNLQFMKKVAKKYDPNEVFQNLAPGDFRLKNAGNGHSSR